MATLGQQSSFVTVPPIPGMKWISSLSMTSYLLLHISKHNVLIIDGDINAQISKDENNKFTLHDLSKKLSTANLMSN